MYLSQTKLLYFYEFFACRMSFQDFCKYFTTLEMCSLGPDSMSGDEDLAKNKWEATQEAGQWVRRVNAGGCRNFLGKK